VGDVSPPEEIPIRDEADVVRARIRAREWAARLGFSLVDQTKILTAASELARNTLIHGRGGRCFVSVLERNGRVGLSMAFEDRGPGIQDVGKALEDGFSTAGGLGLGLGGARRLLGDLTVESRMGEGTRVVGIKWR